MKVNAQPYFTVNPTKGNSKTDIFLQIRGLPGSGFYEVYYLYIFWDDTLLGVFPDNSQTYDHYFDTHFSPLNEGNYSAVGNHTVYFEVWNYHRTTMFINATFLFTIIQYLPNDEYLALNATYSTLLNSYNALNASYTALQAQYDVLASNYSSILASYNTLLLQYNGLLDDHTSLSDSYGTLASKFISLNSSCFIVSGNYQSLNVSYSNLQDAYNQLQVNFVNLQGNYNGLNMNYNNLETDYEALVSNANTTRNLEYVLVFLVIVLIALTVYLAMRKPTASTR
jgi:hypothetical protein